jgi:hypothetical protein
MDRPRAFSPSPRTTPDTSCEGMTGVRSRPSRVVHDRSQVSSANVMPAACTSTRASPGPGYRDRGLLVYQLLRPAAGVRAQCHHRGRDRHGYIPCFSTGVRVVVHGPPFPLHGNLTSGSHARLRSRQLGLGPGPAGWLREVISGFGNTRYKWEPTMRGDRTGAARRDASAVRRDPGTVHAGVVPAVVHVGERAAAGQGDHLTCWCPGNPCSRCCAPSVLRDLLAENGAGQLRLGSWHAV